MDPLRKRPTTFSRSQRDPSAAESQVSSVWTETPAEKAQRLADELAGVKRDKVPNKEEKKRMVEAAAAAGSGGPGEAGRKRAREEEVRREIERHNVWPELGKDKGCADMAQKTSRGPSLLEKHAAGRDASAEEPKAIWDHDRDMGITGRLLNNEERQQKIKSVKSVRSVRMSLICAQGSSQSQRSVRARQGRRVLPVIISEPVHACLTLGPGRRCGYENTAGP